MTTPSNEANERLFASSYYIDRYIYIYILVIYIPPPTTMEVDNGPLEDYVPLPRGGSPLP